MLSRRSIALFVGVVMLSAACAPTELVDASGAEIYDQLCARCHGVELVGGVAPPMEIATQTDEHLRTVIRDGVGVMQGFGDVLSEDQVDRVIAYLRSQSSGEER